MIFMSISRSLDETNSCFNYPVHKLSECYIITMRPSQVNEARQCTKSTFRSTITSLLMFRASNFASLYASERNYWRTNLQNTFQDIPYRIVCALLGHIINGLGTILHPFNHAYNLQQ
jgi:hypothetical protein